jgi:hypothetical protein
LHRQIDSSIERVKAKFEIYKNREKIKSEGQKVLITYLKSKEIGDNLNGTEKVQIVRNESSVLIGRDKIVNGKLQHEWTSYKIINEDLQALNKMFTEITRNTFDNFLDLITI